jgi:hypothetical protein
MKFFTRAWAVGELSDAAFNETIAEYERHLDGLAPRLPATIRCLARELNLHDGLIRRAVYDRSGRELRLELRCGDNQMGYFDLDLMYFGAILDQADITALQGAARDSETEVWYDEVDLAGDGAFLHRVLFHPSRECEIMFRALGLRLLPRADRSLPGFPDRYVEGDPQAS